MSYKTTKDPADIFQACYPPQKSKETTVAALPLQKGIRGRRCTNLQALAKEHSMEAMQKVIELTNDPNPCVRFGAAKLVLKLMHRLDTRSDDRSAEKELTVTIRRFKEEKKSGTKTRRGKLPLVPGRRKGSRDAGDDTGEGVPALRGKRTGVCDKPGVGHGTAAGVQGPGAKTRSGCSASTTGIDGDTEKT